jgi:aminopeptidase N
MMQTLVGRDGFAMGMKLYFQRHDGQAVTCDEFVQAIADANPATELYKKLDVFKHWYAQSGTPKVDVEMSHDLITQRLTLHFTQSCPATPGQLHKLPFLIPIQFGLLNENGQPVLPEQLLVMAEAKHTLVIENMASPVIPSLLRGFSAPVQLQFPHSQAQLLVLLAHDTDAFNRWEASQRLYLAATMQALAQDSVSDSLLSEEFIRGLRQVLRHPELDPAFKELVLTPPSESYIAEQAKLVDPQKIHQVRETMRRQIALDMHEDWTWTHAQHRAKGEYSPDAKSSGLRALHGLALNYLCLAGQFQHDDQWARQALEAFSHANNMTERMHALQALVSVNHALAAQALASFHHQFKHEELVLDKWFSVQASACDHDGHVLGRVRQLMQHPDFQIRNPNRARSLVSSFCSNPAAFHRTDASGYVFWSERVLELDSFNPQVAARLARALDRWRKLSEPYRSAAHEAIRRVCAKEDLSADVREVIDSALED